MQAAAKTAGRYPVVMRLERATRAMGELATLRTLTDLYNGLAGKSVSFAVVT